MKFIAISLFLLLTAFANFAQINPARQKAVYKNETPQKRDFVFQKQATVNFAAISKDYNPILMMKEMPKQRTEKIEKYNYPGETPENKSSNLILPSLNKGRVLLLTHGV